MKKKIAKRLQQNCKQIVKKIAKCGKQKFLLCKIFAKFLQILNLHTDFRPREESVRGSCIGPKTVYLQVWCTAGSLKLSQNRSKITSLYNNLENNYIYDHVTF